jgi:hypothetical protein
MPRFSPMDLPISRPDNIRWNLAIRPPETFSGSMRDRKSRAHERISIDYPKTAKIGD